MSSSESQNELIDPLSAEAGYELSDVNIVPIVIFTICCVIAIVSAIFILDGYFVHTKEKLLRESTQFPHTELLDVRAEAKEKLTTYSVIDKEKGIYRIPITRAMQIQAEEAFSKNR